MWHISSYLNQIPFEVALDVRGAAVTADVAAPEGARVRTSAKRSRGKHTFHLLPSHSWLPSHEAVSPANRWYSTNGPSHFLLNLPSAQRRPTENRSRSDNSSGNLNIWRLQQNYPVAFKHLRASAMRMCWPPHLGTITALRRTMWTAPIVY